MDEQEKAEWSKLLFAAGKLRELGPYKDVSEEDIFGVKCPDTGEIAYVSVMGSRGPDISVAAYLGTLGLQGFEELLHGRHSEEDGAKKLIEIPHLQMLFGSRNSVDEHERSVFKELNLHYRGSRAWPQFRSFRPGFFPWHLDSAERRMMRVALEQLIEMLPRWAVVRAGASAEDGTLLVRVPIRLVGAVQWEDRFMRPPEEKRVLFGEVPEEKIERVKALPSGPGPECVAEIDLLQTKFPVIERKGDRPYFGQILVLADPVSFYILGTEMFGPLPDYDAMLCILPGHFLDVLLAANMRPAKLLLRKSAVGGILDAVASRVGIKTEFRERLCAVTEIEGALDKMPPP